VMSPGSDRGSVTLVAAATMGLIVVLTLGAADLGSALVAREQARSAADAAALAAAQELVLPTGRAPIDVARDFAEENGASLVACACGPGSAEAVVTVTVAVRPFLLLPGTRDVSAIARAVVGLTGVSSSHQRSRARRMFGNGRLYPSGARRASFASTVAVVR
jgi:secretion/DNA translocation related TadE-like protein